LLKFSKTIFVICIVVNPTIFVDEFYQNALFRKKNPTIHSKLIKMGKISCVILIKVLQLRVVVKTKFKKFGD